MIKNLVLIISYFFRFRKPRFTQLYYADFVIDGNASFLVSWEIKNGYRLKIKALHYRTYKASGSAYIHVPDNVEHIELVIANFWRSECRQISLIREVISSQVDFFPVKQYEELTSKAVYTPQLKLALKTPQVHDWAIIQHIPAFTIKTENLKKT
jgi:hypothetical protein